jgi:hypothetical protein
MKVGYRQASPLICGFPEPGAPPDAEALGLQLPQAPFSARRDTTGWSFS